MSNRKIIVFVVHTSVCLPTDWMTPCIMYVGKQTSTGLTQNTIKLVRLQITDKCLRRKIFSHFK